MAVTFHVTVDSAKVERLVDRSMGSIYPRLGNRIVNNARNRAPGPGNSIWRNPPPLQPTGNLRNSIGWRMNGDTLEVFAAARYAIYVHEGTGRMDARPFLKEAMEEELDRLT